MGTVHGSHGFVRHVVSQWESTKEGEDLDRKDSGLFCCKLLQGQQQAQECSLQLLVLQSHNEKVNFSPSDKLK